MLFPSLSREVASGNHAEFVGLLTRALRLLTFVMLPIAVLGAILRVEAVAVLFGRFDPAAIELTAATLLAFLVGLVAHAADRGARPRVLRAARTRGRRSPWRDSGRRRQHDPRRVALVGPLGLPGLALAIAIAAWLEATVLLRLLRRRVGRLGLRAVAWLGLRTSSLATAIAGLAAPCRPRRRRAAAGAGSGRRRASRTPRPRSRSSSIVSAVFGAVFVVAALALRIEELRSIVGIMVDALRRPRRS